jgi:hypothetical protein
MSAGFDLAICACGQTAVDTARAQGLPEHPMTRKPITLTFHWLITKLPVMDFRQQVVGLHEKPFLESKCVLGHMRLRFIVSLRTSNS